VDVNQTSVKYHLQSGSRLTIQHRGEAITLETGAEKTVPLHSEIKAVVFDLDGVITDTAEFHYRAWKKLADEIGIPFDHEYNENLKGIGRMESLDLILARSSKTFTQAEKVAMAERKNGYYKDLLEEITPNDLLPGMKSLLPALRAGGMKLALASASRNAPAILDRLNVRGLFDYVVDAGAVAKSKPDPEIFLRAAEALKLDPSACLGVEDAEAGVTAIRKSGMRAFAVGNPTRLAAAERVFPDTEQLCKALIGLLPEPPSGNKGTTSGARPSMTA
jgi:alpha,alpha-trehalose phosphorylase